MIEITRVQSPEEAQLLRAQLESSGIRVFIKDELTVTAYHFYSDAIGGIRILVPREDRERALEVLSLPALDIPSCACPHCGSSDIRYMKLSRMNGILIFFNLYLPLKKREMFCLSCNRIFREKDRIVPDLDHNEDLRILTEQALEAPQISVEEQPLPIYFWMLKWLVLLPLILWMLSPVEDYLRVDYPKVNLYAAAAFIGAFLVWLCDKSNRSSKENPDHKEGGGAK